MSEQKKAIKCGSCGKEGHNKRTCPNTKSDKVLEVKEEPQIIYLLEYAEDNGDTVQRSHTLYASIDGLVKGIEKLIRDVQTDLGSDEDDNSNNKLWIEDPSYIKELFYYTPHESMKDVPTPTKEYIENVLNNNKRLRHLNGLIIQVGELDAADGFACEISVRKETLNP